MDKIIFDFFTGNLAPKRQKRLTDWLNASPANKALFDQLRDREYILREMELIQSRNPQNQQAHWARIQKSIAAIPPGPARRPVRWLKLVGIAAACIGLLGLGAIGYRHFWPGVEPGRGMTLSYFQPAIPRALVSYNDGPFTSSDTIQKRTLQQRNMLISDDGKQLLFRPYSPYPVTAIQEAPATGDFFRVRTAPGNTYSVSLPDGSTAQLNAAASIKIPVTYNPLKREITMEGQNYFAVKPASKDLAPFFVHVRPPALLQKWFAGDGDLMVVATGTNFDIRANLEDSSIMVVLFKGKLEVQRPGDATLNLQAGQAYVLDYQGRARKLPMAELPGAGSWREKEFRFEFEPAGRILDELGRWYGATIKYKERPAGLFWLKGKRTEPIDYFLSRMKDEHYFNYTKIKDTIIVMR